MKELYNYYINLHTTELEWVMVLNKYSITYNIIYNIYSYLSIEPMQKIHFMHVPHVLPDAAIA